MVVRAATFGMRYEEAVARALVPLGFRPASSDRSVDLETADQRTILEIKASRDGGPGDLSAAATRLAVACHRQRAERAILAWWCSRFATERVRQAWTDVTEVMSPAIARRLQLVMVTPDAQLVLPEGGPATDVVAALREAAATGEALEPVTRPDRSYEVLKILLLRWLRRDPPIPMRELQAQSGLSHPTAASRVRELGESIERTSNRSVALREVPVRAWTELLALSTKVRQSTGFEDRSGRPPDLGAVLARLRRQRPAQVALGGVVAARHWQGDFDLDGVPRLDLEIHAPLGHPDLRFVSRLDPALSPVRPGAAPLLVVHVVTRAVSHFERAASDGLPWADAVETLLDLHQMRLYRQADEFMRHWRARP